MKQYTYPLSTSTWDEDELKAIKKVIDSNYFTMGRYVKEFENKFAQYLNCKYCIMVNSGSSANLLMVAALFYTKNKSNLIKKGDEIIVPAVSWSTSYFPFYQYGLKLKFVDIDLHTLNYDLNKLSDAISHKTRIILAVNLCGNSNDYDAINKMISKKNIILLEDNCESLGSEFKGKKTGTFGKISTCSFYYSHHISTIEGGMIATNDEEIYHILLSLRSHGWTRHLPEINKIYKKNIRDSFFESYNFILPGYNVRPNEFSGAIGIQQLKKLPKFILNRRKNAKLFVNTFINDSKFIIQKEIGKSSWFWFTLIVSPEIKETRRDILLKLNSRGFETRPIVAGNFLKNPSVKYMEYEIHSTLKNSNYLHDFGFAIGNHHYPMEEAFEKLKEI